jgi:hypothetical protein
MDTLESESPPYFVVSRGPAFVDDWYSAVAIRKALERLARELV